jgi:uroporphyrinogen decarboxylase
MTGQLREFHEELTSHERLEALLSGCTLDRVPCHPFIGDHAARVLGIPVGEYHRSAEKMAAAQVAAWRIYGHDWVGIGPVLGMAEILGSTVIYPDEAAPYFDTHALEYPAILDRLCLPDPADPRIAIYLDAVRRIRDEIGHLVPVALNVRSPFSTAANLRGAENLLRDLICNPDFAHRLLQFTLDATLRVIEAARPLGITFGTSDPVASGSLISPCHFREFALPYEKELITVMNSAGRYPALLHICGNTRKIWPDMADTGAGFLSLDDVVDLAEAKGAVGDRVVIVGNVRPTESMYLGDPATVRADAAECLRKAADSPKGFVLAVGCGMPIPAPQVNVHALMNVAREARLRGGTGVAVGVLADAACEMVFHLPNGN